MRRVQLLILATVLATLATARPLWHELEGYHFEQYVKDFAKPHKRGTAEWAMREENFNRALKRVAEHNSGKHSWKKGINHMSDWTEAEFKQIRGNVVSMKKQVDTRPERLHARTSGPLPRFVDWRTAQPPVLTAVKDQGQCGSCWAHAATESIETHAAIASGALFVLSQQQITSCTPNPQQCGGTGGCNGAIAELAFDYIKTTGIQQEWTMPYTSYFGNSGTCPGSISYQMVNISGYTAVAHNDADAVLDALAHAGPLAISVDASSWSDYESGIFSGCNYAANISMDHAVQAVGYGHDYESGHDYWLVRNSWSAGWGEAGFIRLLRNPTTHSCGWNVDPANGDGCKGQTAPEWACGMCGIAYDTLYPNFAPIAN